jgi:hypothetical protein
MKVQPRTQTQGDLVAILAQAEYIGAVIELYKNNLNPTPFNVVADFTLVTVLDMPGYAAQPLTAADGVFIDNLGNAEQVFDAGVFVASAAPGAPLTVYGYFVTNAAGTVVLFSERFAVPVIVANAFDAVQVDPSVVKAPMASPP